MRINKKLAVVAAVTGVVALGAGTAYAYWSTSGSGTGAATVTAPLSAAGITVTDVGSAGAMVPGGGAQDIAFTISNPADYRQLLGNTTVVVDPAWTAGTCDFHDFTITAGATTAGVSLTKAGTPTDHISPSGYQISMIDSVTKDQNSCKGAAPKLNVSVAAG